LRYGAQNSVFNTFFAPMFQMDVPVEKMSEFEKVLKVSLKRLDQNFLVQEKYLGEMKEVVPEFIGGLYEVSIADLSAYCQIAQLLLINFDISSFKNIQKWKKQVEQLPYFQNVHLVLNQVYQKSKL
jgi:glutathione S-transferase